MTKLDNRQMPMARGCDIRIFQVFALFMAWDIRWLDSILAVQNDHVPRQKNKWLLPKDSLAHGTIVRRLNVHAWPLGKTYPGPNRNFAPSDTTARRACVEVSCSSQNGIQSEKGNDAVVFMIDSKAA
jgi:hypothetical protein